MQAENTIKVIGVGNAMRGDDGVGPAVARMLQSEVPPGVEVLYSPSDGAALMDYWKGSETVVLVDAVQAGGSAGTIYRLDAVAERIPTSFFHYSTHAFGVAEAVEMARALGTLPPALIVFGIEGKTFEAGPELSPEVSRAAEVTRERIKLEIMERLARQHADADAND